MAFNSISDLKTNIQKGGGLAVQNRFRVQIGGVDWSVECESATLPGRQIMSLDYQINRQPIKVATGYMNEDVTLTFLVTNDFRVVKYFKDWIGQTIEQESYRLKYLDTYRKDVVIEQLDKNNVSIGKVQLRNAWPVTLNALNLDNTAENSPQKLVVTLTYEDWY
jgi:hypothetical protein